jgi:hypothetical protein
MAAADEDVHDDGLVGGCFAVDLEETGLDDGGGLVECIRRVGGGAANSFHFHQAKIDMFHHLIHELFLIREAASATTKANIGGA